MGRGDRGPTWSETIFEQRGLDPGLAPPTFDDYVQTIHPDDRQVFLDTIEQTLASRETFNLEFRLLQPDGTVAWTAGFGRVFRDADGRAIRMIGTGTNITEGRRLEAERDQLLADERRAGAFREAFIDVISHELRTPITTIFGLTQILARPGRVDDAVERVGLIDDIAVESERLFRLVEDLLVLTRAERGHVAVEAEPLELRRLLARVIEHEQARLPGLDIKPDIPRDLPVVAGEATYVEQIVRNILSNAAKYTPRGTKVIVRAEQIGDTVAVRVLDDGPGIDQVAAERASSCSTAIRSVRGPWPGRDRPVRLRQPSRGHGRHDLGAATTGGRSRVRVHPARPPRRRDGRRDRGRRSARSDGRGRDGRAGRGD